MNYNINYTQLGGKIYTCPDCGFHTSNALNSLYNELFPHYRDYGHGDITKNRTPFFKNSQMFVKLKLNHIGMKNKLNEVRRNANFNGEFNSIENDTKMQYHVSLLQIYFNIRHPKFRTFLNNKDELLKLINKNFITAFYNESFQPLDIEILGENFIVQKLKVNDSTFLKYVNAKRKFYSELNKLLGKATNENSVYYPRSDIEAKGKRFFVNGEPFLFIRDFYLTPNNSKGIPTNNFVPHISVLSIKEHGLTVGDEEIKFFTENVQIPNPISINEEFSVISEISINEKSIDPNIINDTDIIKTEKKWHTLGFREDYFSNKLRNTILFCNKF